MPSARPAAAIEPCSAIPSRSATFPGPIRKSGRMSIRMLSRAMVPSAVADPP